MEDSFPPELDTELLRQLGQQRLTELQGRHDDLQVLGAQHGRHLTGEKGRIENLLQQTCLCVDNHPQHGLQSCLSHTRSGTGRVDFQQDRKQDPGQLGGQLLPLLALGVTDLRSELRREEPLDRSCGAALLPKQNDVLLFIQQTLLT